MSGTSKINTETASIRVSPHSYLVVLFVMTFVSALLIYAELEIYALILLAVSWVTLPFLAFTDRVVFDGRRLSRTGAVPKLWASMNRLRRRLKLTDIEQVETQTVRGLKRGGSVSYSYRTTIRGKNVTFAFSSAGGDYRRMIRAVLPKVPENVLDNRSIEVRDYICERREAQKKAAASEIPPADVLVEGSFAEGHSSLKHPQNFQLETVTSDDSEKAQKLRQLANELRLSGSLLQAIEAFRRAVLIKPKDGWLLFDFARCLQSFAGSERNADLERRAIAMMRLAEQRAGGDVELLARIGENYFQLGEWRRAGIAFQKGVETVGEHFRSVRGLAEIALREGKIAHVIHNFSTAGRLAETPALRRWAAREVEYFSRLNEDDEYMELEISRVNLVDTLEKVKRAVFRMTLFGFPVILFGILVEDSLIANIGWAVSGVSLFVWVAVILLRNLLSSRIPFDLVKEE